MAKKKLDYDKVAHNIILNIGGKENINGLRHCITRVRFRLKDESKANDEVIKSLEGVISVVKGGGEYMVVIGNAVEEVYDAVCNQLGMIDGVSNEGSTSKDEKNTNIVMKVLNTVVGAVGPCLNIICAGGVLKGLLTILKMTNIVHNGSGIDILISAIGDAVFYFLPIFLGLNLAKHLKGDPFLGAFIGAILCYPTINGVDLSIFGISVKATYTSSFLPVVAVTAIAIPLSKLLNKYIPKVVSGFLTPVITLLIAIPLGFTFIGPAVNYVGGLVNAGISTLLNAVPLLGGILFTGLYQVMVLFGIHAALTSFSFMSLLSGKPDAVMAMAMFPSFAQIGVVLAMYLRTKDQKLRSVALPSFISGIFGVTEPAIYGVTLPHIKMFVISCIGAAASGAVVMLSNTVSYTFSGMGIFALLGMVNSEHPSFFYPILAAVVGFAVSFVLGFILFKDEEQTETNETEEENNNEISTIKERFEIESPVPGKVVSITKVPDETFASGMVGHGLAVEPSEGKVFAPFDGVCEVMFETLHALGLKSENGVDLLIHVGLETVSMNGKPFKAHVKSGDKIKKGQLLLEFDIKQIQEAGYPTITPVLVTNESEVGEVKIENNKIVIGD